MQRYEQVRDREAVAVSGNTATKYQIRPMTKWHATAPPYSGDEQVMSLSIISQPPFRLNKRLKQQQLMTVVGSNTAGTWQKKSRKQIAVHGARAAPPTSNTVRLRVNLRTEVTSYCRLWSFRLCEFDSLPPATPWRIWCFELRPDRWYSVCSRSRLDTVCIASRSIRRIIFIGNKRVRW
jgi:hypothetical protein